MKRDKNQFDKLKIDLTDIENDEDALAEKESVATPTISTYTRAKSRGF